jgi:hypothetical protein
MFSAGGAAMAAIPFDTLKLARALRDDGKMPPDQAEGVANALAEAFRDEISTKSDLRDLEQRLTIKVGAMLVALSGFLTAIKFFGH